MLVLYKLCNVKSLLAEDGRCSNAMDTSIFLFWRKKKSFQGFKIYVIFMFSISEHKSQQGTKVIIHRVQR